MLRFETWLLGVCSLVWLLVSLAFGGVVPLSGLWDLDLYRLFSFSGALGWLAGNVYVYRRRRLFGEAGGPIDAGGRGEGGGLRPSYRRRFLFVYLLAPPSLLYLLRVMSSKAAQEAAPFVPIYSLCVYGLFFLVPVTLKVGRSPLHR